MLLIETREYRILKWRGLLWEMDEGKSLPGSEIRGKYGSFTLDGPDQFFVIVLNYP